MFSNYGFKPVVASGMCEYNVQTKSGSAQPLFFFGGSSTPSSLNLKPGTLPIYLSKK